MQCVAHRRANLPRWVSSSIQVIAFALTVAHSIAWADTQIPIAEANQGLLVGQWQGTFESKSPAGFYGPVYYADTVTLQVFSLTEGAQFSMPGSGVWRTGILLRDGKVLMTFGRATRPFSVERDVQGQLHLKLSYEGQYNNAPSYATVVLKKL